MDAAEKAINARRQGKGYAAIVQAAESDPAADRQKAVEEQRARAAKQRKRGALSKLAMMVAGDKYSSIVD